MRKNAEHIVNLFLAGRSGGNDTLHTDGRVIRSYDMPIAQRRPSGRIEVITRSAGPTSTTRTHISGVFFGLNAHGAKVVDKLTGFPAHVFRDRAGAARTGGRTYIQRHRALTPVAAPVARRLKLVK